MNIEPLLRQEAMEWWNKLTLEQQFYKTIAANKVIAGDKSRHPHSLTGKEIQAIKEFHELKESS